MKESKILCIRKCNQCGKKIEIRHKERVNRKEVFCSKECEIKYKKKQREEDKKYFNCECPICGKKFHLKPSRVKKSKNHYCSIECHSQAKKEYMLGDKNHQYGLKGEKNSSWKSDKKITNYGYVKIRKLDHPFRDIDGFVFEHRLVAEKYLLNEENSIEINGKKYLKKEYVVHHKDRNKKNNNVSNLEIMTLKEHTGIHSKNRNCKSVNKYDLNGNYIKTYTSIKEAGKINNIFPQNISKACNKTNRTAGGYIWKYV